MTRPVRRLLVALPLALAAPAAAKTDWTKTPLDPAKAYILVEIAPVEFRMLGNNRLSTGVFLAPYDAERGVIRLTEVPNKGLQTVRLILKDDPVLKQDKHRQYFVAIQPGTWVFEGTGENTQLIGAPLTAFALGSYRFEAKAGEIIDLGVITPGAEPSDNPDTKLSGGKMFGMMMGGLFGGGRVEPLPLKLSFRPRREGDLPLPKWLANAKLTHPAFTYGATFANTLGGLVNRVDGSAGRNRPAGEVVYPVGGP